MSKFQYYKDEDGAEVLTDLGQIMQGLDESERRILWQALTIDVLGPLMKGDDDLLHVMFGKRDDGQYRAQVDRQKDGSRAEHLLWWHGDVEEEKGNMKWRAR